MADGELAAVFRGLVPDVAKMGENFTESHAGFSEDTMERALASARQSMSADQAVADSVKSITEGSRPDLGPLEGGGEGAGADGAAGSGTGTSGRVNRLAQLLNGESQEDLAQTGGSSFRRPRSEMDFETEWADHAYSKIRQDPQLDAVSQTASSYGFSGEDIEQIYNHVFTESHELDDGVRQFDANPRMARAWERLQDGTPHPSDIQLLQHELHESNWMEDNGNQNYRMAHQATIDAGYTWDEDGPERDGIPYR